MVSITETDVVAELIYFAIDRELTRIRTSVGNEPKAIDHGHRRVRDHEIAVEEELQHRDANAANHSAPGRCLISIYQMSKQQMAVVRFYRSFYSCNSWLITWCELAT